MIRSRILLIEFPRQFDEITFSPFFDITIVNRINFFAREQKLKKKISSANFPFKKKKRALKFQKTRSFLSLRASGLPIFLALAGRQAIPPPSLPRPRVKISYRRAMRNFSSRMDYAESRTARGQSGGERGRGGGGGGSGEQTWRGGTQSRLRRSR